MARAKLRLIRAGAVLHRIHRPEHDPIFFGPDGSKPLQRYDSPDGTYKILYAARSLETAFGETLVRLPDLPFILSTDVAIRCRSELRVVRPIRLYPLIDAGVSADGLSFTDLHGASYRKTQAVAGWVNAETSADGILYTSRFDNQLCVALFDRARDALAKTAANAVPIYPEVASRLSAHFGKVYVEP